MPKDKSKIYAEALSELALNKKSEGPERSRGAERFLKLLEKNGLLGKAKKIVAMAEDIVLKKTGKRKIILETARKMTSGQKKMAESFVKEGDIVLEKINPEIIAGIKIIINDSKQFDASMRQKLLKIL